MRGFAIFLFIFVAAGGAFSPGAGAHTPHDPGNAPIDLAASAGYLFDPRGDFDIATVRRLARADFGAADPLQGIAAPEGTAWVRLDVPRHVGDGEWWLSIGPATVDAITVYSMDASGRPAVRELGTSVAFVDRPVRFRMPVFPIRLDAAPASRTLYLRIAGQGLARVEPVLWPPSAFADMAQREYALWGAYFGILALLIAFTLFLWLELRSAAYLRYSLYLGAFFSMLWLLEGFGAQWLLPASPETAAYLSHALAFVAMGYTLWFSLKLLELGRRFDAFHRVAGAIAWMQASGAVAILFMNHGTVLRAALIGALAWQPVFFALLGYQWRHRPDLRPVIVAFAPQTLALVVVALRHIGMTPPGFWASHALEFTGILHIVVLSLVLVRRLRDSERRALALSRESEERLDRKVDERTSELADANRRLLAEVAERRAAQAKLASSLKSERRMLDAQRDFIAMVSHEFRTPLAVIKAAAQRMRLHPSLQSDDLQHRLGRVDRATARMTAMMETYLADDRMRAPERARQATRFSPAALAAAAAEHHGGADSRVRIDVPGDAPQIEGDFALLTVALANLIDNALKYSAAPAPAVVAATWEDGMVRFRIADRGAGVAESERERIFQRYVRGSASSGRGGAGLGLHLAQEIARLHGGDIAIERSSPAGSVFVLTLPRVAAGSVEPATRGVPAMDQREVQE